MPGLIALVGGDEFRPGCEDIDRAIMAATGVEPPIVLVVPTAAVTGPQKAASDGVRYFTSLGGQASDLMVLNRSDAEDEGLATAISGASVIYFTGGDPEYLLATLRESKLLSSIREELGNGAVLAGSSAGAMVMGSMMWSRSSKRWVQGLAIAEGVSVLPHHEQGNPTTIAEWLESTGLPQQTKVLGIDARTACLGSPGSWRAIGSGKVTTYRNGTWTTFSSGQSLPQGF